MRGDHNYEKVPSPHRIRISTFGDSFTHGDGVYNHETWQEKLNSLHHKLEVLNFGVPGFGLDQAFLRFQHDGIEFTSNIVFIGFMSADIRRGVNTYRPFALAHTGLPLSKPRFIIEDDQLVL
ncbi:hypothetical protein C2W62_47755 [Candidatus Entotheonella serta]|nr:hypothetical protein C2W62_47755 [Candidatus Entotheonella serta]